MHSFAYSEEEEPTLFSWGLNKTGQLGLGDTSPRAIPCEVKLDDLATTNYSLIDMDCGSGHSGLILESNGKRRVFLFGNGQYGQLGRGAMMESVAGHRLRPVEITDSFTKGNPHKIALGSDHSLCLSLEK